MSWNDFVYGVADVCQWAFSGLEGLGMLPNILFIIIGFVALGWWVMQMLKHNQEEKG